MSAPLVAVLDLGSNTFRLMLAEKRPEGVGTSSADPLTPSGALPLWRNKKVYQHIPRLSEHLTSGGNFAPEALKRAWESLEEFDGRIKAAGAGGRVVAGATMAARLAGDGPDFMAEISRRFGWETHILNGDEEARLTAAGVLSVLEPLPESGLIFDIGGRSTEFITTSGRTIVKSRSLAMGVVGLTETHLSDPIRPGQLAALAEAVKTALAEADFSDVPAGTALVGTAGTVTTAAALLLGLKDYDPELVNNARLGRDKISNLLAALAAVSVAERVSRYRLHPRRADAIAAGLAMVLEIMDHFGRPEMLVSDNGLLEGIWLKAVQGPGWGGAPPQDR